jgi:hypothetical protein
MSKVFGARHQLFDYMDVFPAAHILQDFRPDGRGDLGRLFMVGHFPASKDFYFRAASGCKPALFIIYEVVSRQV